jgi:hypothetical protein
MVAVVGLWAGRVIADGSGDPASQRVMLWTALVILLSLSVLAGAIWTMVESIESGLRFVFFGRPLFVRGLLFLGAAGALTASVKLGNQFSELTSRGQFTAAEIAGIGCVLGAIVCLIGAGVALLDARQALRDERQWSA